MRPVRENGSTLMDGVSHRDTSLHSALSFVFRVSKGCPAARRLGMLTPRACARARPQVRTAPMTSLPRNPEDRPVATLLAPDIIAMLEESPGDLAAETEEIHPADL